MSDWRNDIDDLFAKKQTEDEEQVQQIAIAGKGVVDYFREVVEPALNEIQEKLESQPQCEVENRTYTNTAQYCASNFKVTYPGMTTFELEIRADVSPKGVRLIAKQVDRDIKGRYGWEKELASASNGHELAQFDGEQIKQFVVKELKQRMSGR